MPRSVAQSLNIAPKSSGSVTTAGGAIKIDISSAEVQIGEKKDVVRIAISDAVDRILVGFTTPEILGLAIDPRDKRAQGVNVSAVSRSAAKLMLYN